MIAKLKTLRRIVISSSVGLCCVVTTESDTHYPLSAHSGSNLTIQILKSISPLPPPSLLGAVHEVQDTIYIQDTLDILDYNAHMTSFRKVLVLKWI